MTIIIIITTYYLLLITACIITSAILFQFFISLLPPFRSFSMWLFAFFINVGCWILVLLRFAFLFFARAEWLKFSAMMWEKKNVKNSVDALGIGNGLLRFHFIS